MRKWENGEPNTNRRVEILIDQDLNKVTTGWWNSDDKNWTIYRGNPHHIHIKEVIGWREIKEVK